ncbi:unnamed protein product [Vitrella brassicaformis CCMP3155]|uniref:Uncharacterized protein n=1 Tax=Vitrella brassicaformis (strain CCMP3155) TaxID=1169540 RepID=A0A0G4ET28_VITBC|nr:unnamed protein product [Vitrella brassicaformis CCMP3155]|eukprot:CEM00866.1 unnamed protein product [Vitrella brassicaformis CCMP3155]
MAGLNAIKIPLRLRTLMMIRQSQERLRLNRGREASALVQVNRLLRHPIFYGNRLLTLFFFAWYFVGFKWALDARTCGDSANILYSYSMTLILIFISLLGRSFICVCSWSMLLKNDADQINSTTSNTRDAEQSAADEEAREARRRERSRRNRRNSLRRKAVLAQLDAMRTIEWNDGLCSPILLSPLPSSRPSAQSIMSVTVPRSSLVPQWLRIGHRHQQQRAKLTHQVAVGLFSLCRSLPQRVHSVVDSESERRESRRANEIADNSQQPIDSPDGQQQQGVSSDDEGDDFIPSRRPSVTSALAAFVQAFSPLPHARSVSGSGPEGEQRSDPDIAAAVLPSLVPLPRMHLPHYIASPSVPSVLNDASERHHAASFVSPQPGDRPLSRSSVWQAQSVDENDDANHSDGREGSEPSGEQDALVAQQWAASSQSGNTRPHGRHSLPWVVVGRRSGMVSLRPQGSV